VEEEPEIIHRSYRAALKRVFYDYLPRAYYLHRDLFRDALLGMAEKFGVTLEDEQIERYHAVQRERRERDFALREGALETLETLRARGLHLGIVSNADEDQLARMVELIRLDRYFDSILSSEKAQSCKPNGAIFEQALQQAGCAPEEAFFIGDSIHQDIEGANCVGLRSILIWDRVDSEPPDRGPRPHHVIRRIPELLRVIP
jgi:HAD superfamily hydrolase (TIGR01509 family)